jgi:hypothetical protein
MSDWVMHCVDAFSDDALSNGLYIPLRNKSSGVDRIVSDSIKLIKLRKMKEARHAESRCKHRCELYRRIILK